MNIIGFTCSTFDLLHAGHVLMLEDAKARCDRLICGLQVDTGGRKPPPIQTLVERYIQLKAVKHVDEIVPYETEADLEDLLKVLPIDIRFLGEDYRGKPITGEQICRDRGIKICYTSRAHGWSTTELRHRVCAQRDGEHVERG